MHGLTRSEAAGVAPPLADPDRRRLGACPGALVALGLAIVLGGCGSSAEPDAQVFAGLVAHGHQVTGSVTFRGAVPGMWHASADPPAICQPGVVRITIAGPRPGDVGTLLVDSSGFIYLDVERYGDFQGTGGVFHPSRGFEVDADIATLRGKTAHVTGTLTC